VKRIVILLSTFALSAALPVFASDVVCDHSYAPFSMIAGVTLTATDFVSKDDPSVVYTMWRGTVPSFDGLPLSVDVTIPCGAHGPLPLVEMNHGWTDDKTIWEETGRSDTVGSTFRPGSNAHWNNIWFASRGYAVLNYTARGWHDSCGPQTPGAIDRVLPAPQCLGLQYWIHTDDLRWEIRDTQWLVGALVESSVADPAKLAITGGSYGGGQTSMNALLRDRTVCGGAAVPAELGIDPCAGKHDGDLVPWKTPHGETALAWAVAVPMYTWADSIQALFPNGRGSDGDADAPSDGDHGNPLGVPIESYLVGLFAAGQPLGNGFYAPPGVDPTSDVVVSTARSLAGNPFLAADPIVANGVHQFRFFKSPIEIPLDGVIPIFWVQGLTDPLFTGLHALQIYNKVRAFDSAYPVKLFFGDIGHDYAAERVDEWDEAHLLMNAFLDYYLRPEANLPAPIFDVTAAITRCLDPDSPAELVNASDWSSLHPSRVTFSSSAPGWTFSEPLGREGLATDPVTTATIASPIAYKGCRKMSPATTDPTVASWTFPLAEDLVLMGSPVVDVTYMTSAPDTQLMVRIWDVAGDGSVQGLVTRGAYRSLDGPGVGLGARFQIAPNGYRFAAGHSLKLEVTANDAPYFQPSNVPAAVAIDHIDLDLPTR
jgi:predicted acyl esterase